MKLNLRRNFYHADVSYLLEAVEDENDDLEETEG